jgi:polygalacturonase
MEQDGTGQGHAEYMRDEQGNPVHTGITATFSKQADVTDDLFGAKGDRFTNDTPPIQAAIDAMHAAGGGNVVIPGGHTYLIGDLEIKSHVTLELRDGAVLKQSMNPDHYAHRPEFGAEHRKGIIWDGKYHTNYPMIYGRSGTRNVRITGHGSLEQDDASRDDDENIFMSCIGFFEVEDFEISGIQLRHSHGYFIAIRKCLNGLIRGITISDPERGCPDGWGSDGISFMNCSNMRVTGCNISSDDDLIYIWTSYQDPRGLTWWHSNDPAPTRNIEADHNFCTMLRRRPGEWCHGFGILPWGGFCPHLEQLKISNIHVHDNCFRAPHPIGAIGTDVYRKTELLPPAENIRFENNTLFAIGDTKTAWFETLPIKNLVIS